MRRIAVVIAGAVAAVVAFAAPASAHNDACESYPNDACDVEQGFLGSYVDYWSYWCEYPGGYIDIQKVDVIAKRAGIYQLVLFRNNPTNQVVWKSPGYVLDPWDGVTFLINHFPKMAKGTGLYMRLEMDPVVGYTTYWRSSPLHVNPVHAPYDDVDYTNAYDLDTYNYDCSS
jgi:hypothetical protein